MGLLRQQKRDPIHSNEFCTPELFYEFFNNEFDFKYDAACTDRNKKAKKISTDSLLVEWPKDGWIWLNPPYGNWSEWIDKSQKEAESGSKIVMLVPPVMICTRYFFRFLPKQIRFIVGRLSFELDGVPMKGNMRDSALFIYDGIVDDVKCAWVDLKDIQQSKGF